jgi:hypothetical protein
VAALAIGSGLVLSGQAIYIQASAASVDWVDGGDDSPCLQDDKGAALTSLPADKFCTPIGGCYQDDDGKWVLPSRKTGIWQGDPNQVKYADEIAATPTPTPTTSAPKTTPTKAAPKPSTPTSAPAAGGTTAPTAGTTPVAETAAPAAPTAPGAPTVTVKGSDVTVAWTPTPSASLESVTGYTVQITGAEPAQVGATATSHTFTDLEDGSYRAVVQAVNAAGPSVTSLPSEVATVGTPIAEIAGTVVVDGDLTPGGSVTISGTGFAKDVPELALELHSDPVPLGSVATDASGAFTTSLTIPATVEAGEHSVVVLHDGAQITSTPVTIAAAGAAAAAPAAAETAATGETVPPAVGLAILLGLGLLGLGALVWHVVTGRRRRTRQELLADRARLAETASSPVPTPATAPAATPADDRVVSRPLVSSQAGVS